MSRKDSKDRMECKLKGLLFYIVVPVLHKLAAGYEQYIEKGPK